MSYKKLYDYCQNLTCDEKRVSRKLIKSEILNITGKNKLAFAVSGNLDPKDVRGMFVSVNADSIWAKQHCCDVIIISREIHAKSLNGNYCWDRFITTKEMMHMFDEKLEMADSGDKFEEILNALIMREYKGGDDVVDSEIKAHWRALAVLCPETLRQQFIKDVDSGKLTNYDVALKLRIPEQYVPQLLDTAFENVLKKILN